MPRPAILTLVALVAIPAPASGQSVVETLWQDLVETVPSDVWHVYSAPFRMEREDLSGALWVTAAFLGLASVDADIQRVMREHPRSVPIQLLDPFTETGPLPLRNDEFGLALIGDTQNLMMLSGALYAVGLITGSDDIREAGLGCATADGLNSIFRHLLYDLVARDRPGLKQPDGSVVLIDDPYRIDVPGGSWNRHSFFGGHAANPMSCATFWSRRFELGWLEPVLYGTAGAVGLARMVDERHWASDTFLGLAFGYAVGKTVANRYLERERGERGSIEAAVPEGPRASIEIEPVRRGLYVGARIAF